MNNVPNLRFKEFSGQWNFIKIGDAFKDLSAGSTPSKNIPNYFRGDIPWLTSGELKQKYIYETREYITEEAVKSANLKIYDPGTLFIAITGLEAPGTRGSCAINKVKLTTNQSCMAFKKNNIVDVEFLYYWYQLIGEYIGIKYTQGTKQQSLNNDLVSKLKLAIPSLIEQEKIASFFSLIDKKIELQTEKVEELKNYKKGIMQKIFSQELRFKDDEGNEFPKWEENKLGDICDITTGKLDANAMVEGGMYRFYTCAKEYFQIDKYAFDTEALLISGNGANVGYIHYYNGKFNAYQRTYVLTNFKENILFIKYYLNKNLKRRILEEKNEGNTPYIVLSTLSDMPVKLPCSDEQEKISQFLTPLELKIEKEEMKLDYYQKYKKGLLQQMFI